MATELLVTGEYVRRLPVRVHAAAERVSRSDGHVFVLHWNDETVRVQHHACGRRILAPAVHIVANHTVTERHAVYAQLVRTT